MKNCLQTGSRQKEMQMDINSEISKVKGVGAVRAEAFHKLVIMTVHDLAMHFPRAYDIFMPPVSLGKLRNGYVETIAVTLTSPAKLVARGGKKSIVMLSVREGTESATLMWFNLPFIRKTGSDSCTGFPEGISGSGSWYSAKNG